jgi:hypothetical protein
VRVRTAPVGEEEVLRPPLVRVRTGALEPLLVCVPVPVLPLVWVRTGAGVPGALLEGEVCAGLVRVRGAPAAGETGEAAVWVPLVAVRATAAEGRADAAAEPPARAVPALEPPRLRGGRSWRTTRTVRLITWVRTSAAGCWRCAVEGAAEEPPRSTYAASAPATSVATRAGIRVVALRRMCWLLLGGLHIHCECRPSSGAQAAGKALAKLV